MLLEGSTAYSARPNRTPDLKPAVLLLRSIAVYITQILKVFGVVDGSDDFGFGSGSGTGGGGAASAEAASEPYIETLVSFREQVRNAALDAAKGGDAAACDQGYIGNM